MQIVKTSGWGVSKRWEGRRVERKVVVHQSMEAGLLHSWLSQVDEESRMSSWASQTLRTRFSMSDDKCQFARTFLMFNFVPKLSSCHGERWEMQYGKIFFDLIKSCRWNIALKYWQHNTTHILCFDIFYLQQNWQIQIGSELQTVYRQFEPRFIVPVFIKFIGN